MYRILLLFLILIPFLFVSVLFTFSNFFDGPYDPYAFFATRMVLIIIAMSFSLYMSFVFGKIIANILNKKCDPEKYLVEYEKCYKPRKGRRIYPAHCLNIFSGLIETSNYGEALNIINSISEQDFEKTPNYILYYHLNAAQSCLVDNRLEKAQFHLDEAKKILAIKRWLSRYNKRIAFVSFDYCSAELLFKHDNVEDSRELLTSLLNGKLDKLIRLHCEFLLALIDIREQKIESAKSALQRIILEGNKLYLVNQAKEELDRL